VKQKIKSIIYTFAITAMISSCQLSNQSGGRELARVYDTYLYISDIRDAYPQDISENDSLLFVQNFINNWIENQLVIAKAEKNLPDNKKDFSKELDEYRNSLLIYNYESVLVNQKLDTIVQQEEINSFYQERKNEFPLLYPYVRLIFGEVDQKNKYLHKIRTLFYGNEIARIDSLLYYFNTTSNQSQLDTSQWIMVQELSGIIPESKILYSAFKKGKNRFTITEDNSIFFIEVLDFKKEGEASPLPLIKNQLKKIILNKRKSKIIKDMRNSVKENAKKENIIEIY
jgi:hypothetical protein